MLPGTELLLEPGGTPGGWAPCLRWSARADGYADGWSFVAPVIEMPVYLGWLEARVDELGGTVTRTVALPEPGPVLVVNCAGSGCGCWRTT